MCYVFKNCIYDYINIECISSSHFSNEINGIRGKINGNTQLYAQNGTHPKISEAKESARWKAIRERRHYQDSHQEAKEAKLSKPKMRARSIVNRKGNGRLCARRGTQPPGA